MKKLFVLCLILCGAVNVARAQVEITNYASVDYGMFNSNCHVWLAFNNATIGQTLTAKIYSIQTQNTLTLETFAVQVTDTIPPQYGGQYAKTFLIPAQLPGFNCPEYVQFMLEDAQGNTSVSDTVMLTSYPSSLDLHYPQNGHTYAAGASFYYEVWNTNLPNDVTLEYAPWGTTNYTTIYTSQSYLGFPQVPTTPGQYSIRVRNLNYLDSAMINVIPNNPQFLTITHPQPGDVLTPGAYGLDSITVLCNGNNANLHGYILNADDSVIAELIINPTLSINSPPWDGIRWTYGVGGWYPSNIECNDCKLIVTDTYYGINPTVVDTVQIVVHANTINGRVYYDFNNNGIFDTGDEGYHYPVMTQSPADGQMTTSYNGYYNLRTAIDGQYTITPPVVTVCQNQILPASHTVTVGPGNQNVSGLDFRIVPSTAPYDLSMDWIENRLMIHFGPLSYQLTITNNGGTTSPPGSVTIGFDSLQQHIAITDPSYILGYVLPTSYGPNGATFDVPAIPPCQSHTITMYFRGTVPNGTIVPNHIELSGYPNDGNQANNVLFEELVMIAGVDPNDKQVDKKIIYTPDLNDAQNLLYTIRFQNTGDVPAFNIKVVDTLAANINIASFNAISSSHPYTLVNRGNNVLEFRFDNINLPDSTHFEEQSHGYVSFTVARPDGLMANDVIENFADIYFDYNEPVRTNTATTQIMLPESVAEGKADMFSLYPNPAKGFVQVKLKENISGKTIVKLYSADGKLLQSNTHYLQNAGVFMQDISKLANGVYFIGITTAQGRQAVKKIVVIN